jgi:hypothetical protein
MEATEWKQKALQRAAENKQLKKRIKELTHSRDVWKEKSIEHKTRADYFDERLKKTKRLIGAIVHQDLLAP